MKTHGLIFIIISLFSTTLFADMHASIVEIQHEWEKANYETVEDAQEKAFEALVNKARTAVAEYPAQAEPKVWLAIVLSTDAGVTGGLSALGKVKEARNLLEEAEKIDGSVLDGSVYTSLGSLYYQVPGWPIGFGNDDKAEEYLKKALSMNPTGIDPNYFYGDFMLEEGNIEEAIKYLSKAAEAPPRPDRPLADKGRQREIQLKLAAAKQRLASN